jgi:hypothetical protein
MAMRIYSAEELASELVRRGCEKVRDNDDGSQLWHRDDGRHFLVPEPPDGRGYPDWMLDDLIEQHDLPRAPIKPH